MLLFFFGFSLAAANYFTSCESAFPDELLSGLIRLI
jgi:hypothetical protein